MHIDTASPLHHPPRRPLGVALAATLLLASATPADADQPLWELGAGAGALVLPHYRGSAQNHRWLLPIPYVVYRGDILRSDREGTRAVLLDTELLDVDLSFDGSLPTRSSDNRARTGLHDLAATLEFGPNVNVRLGKGAGWKLNLSLPLRAAFAAESQPKSLGWTFAPVLNLDARWQGWNLGLQGGPQAASRSYNAYFYDVPSGGATPARPAYTARSGYAGWGVATSATRRVGDWWLAGFWRYDSVAGATFAGSPLVMQRSNQSVGLALSWVFKVSETRVPDPR